MENIMQPMSLEQTRADSTLWLRFLSRRSLEPR